MEGSVRWGHSARVQNQEGSRPSTRGLQHPCSPSSVEGRDPPHLFQRRGSCSKPVRTNGEKVTEAVMVERSSKIDRPVTGSNARADGAGLVLGPACAESSAMCRAPWAFGARIFFLLCPSLQFQLPTFLCGICKIKGKKKRIEGEKSEKFYYIKY